MTLTAADLPASPCALRPDKQRLLPLAAALLALAATSAAQAETSPWYLGVSQAITHDSNIYRIGDQQSLGAGLSKSDKLSTTALIGGFNQPYSRQRFSGSASLRSSRYQSNEQLNNNGFGLKLGWDWETANRLSGSLSASADRSLAQFNSLNSVGAVETRRNLIDDRSVDGVVRLGVVTRYTLEATLGHRQRHYSATEYDRYEYRQNSGSIGVRFRPSDLLTLGAALRLTQTDYPRYAQTVSGGLIGDQVNRQDLDLTAQWRPSGNSDLSLRLSPTRSRSDLNTTSDFSGLTGAASWGWQATGKLRFTTHLSRDTGQSTQAYDLGNLGLGAVDYSRTTTGLNLRADWAATAKISAYTSLAYSRRALVDTPTLNGNQLGQTAGRDNTSQFSLGARWAPTRAIQLGCDLSTERRGSDGRLTVGMNGSSLGCHGQFTIQ